MNSEDNKYCNCLYYSSNALARIMTKMADEAFSVTGLSSSYAFLLMIINENPGINPQQISSKMQLAPSTVTRLIEKMEFRGYLKRRQSGRNTEVYPTQLSLEQDAGIRKAWASLFQKYSNILGEDTSRKLTQLINQVTEKFED